jgi:uncharacterized protein YecE (DUF72 family)
VWVGCSGWNYRDWRGGLYPEGEPARRWLQIYAQRFDTVEVNATFYRLPNEQAVEHWVQQTGGDFLFAVKASRYLTHVKRLRETRQGVERFYRRLRPLIDAGRLGPVLWQLPESFQRDEARLDAALRSLPAGRHAVELRHPSWFTDEVYEVLRSHDAALVVGDHPQRPFQTEVATAGWRYVRLHYGKGRRGNYSRRDLQHWAAKVRQWRRDSDVYVYFNNDWEGFAPRNAIDLSQMLKARGQRMKAN